MNAEEKREPVFLNSPLLSRESGRFALASI
jgi:hypothetical protein